MSLSVWTAEGTWRGCCNSGKKHVSAGHRCAGRGPRAQSRNGAKPCRPAVRPAPCGRSRGCSIVDVTERGRPPVTRRRTCRTPEVPEATSRSSSPDIADKKGVTVDKSPQCAPARIPIYGFLQPAWTPPRPYRGGGITPEMLAEVRTRIQSQSW